MKAIQENSFFRCRRFWWHAIPLGLMLVAAIGVSGWWLLREYGNPQWFKFIYMHQAYERPASRSILKFRASDDAVIFPKPPDGYTGVWRGWYSNGQLAFEHRYLSGKKHGRWTDWHQSGRIHIDRAFVNGEGNGRYVRWEECAERYFKIHEHTYHDGKLHGVLIDRALDGSLRERTEYREGRKHGWHRKWHTKDQLYFECMYEDGKPVGIQRKWFFNGKQWQVKDWTAGEETVWHENGTKADHKFWEGEVLEGRRRRWLEDGSLVADGVYRKGTERDGTFRCDHSGDSCYEIMFIQRGDSQKVECYDEKGKLLFTGIYKDGERWSGYFHHFVRWNVEEKRLYCTPKVYREGKEINPNPKPEFVSSVLR